jgi:lipopolysaccharide export system protein LptA
MLKQLSIISIFFLFVLTMQSYGESQKANVKGPITITSESLTADNKAHTALFEKNVVAKTTNLAIYADKMLVFYEEDGGNVTKIEATGNVKVLRESRVITSKSATYYAEEEKVVFAGDPRAVDGDNVVSGTKMIYFMTDDRFLVEKSKVILKSKKDR